MFFTRAARQFTLRIALFAMLMAALAPTISHALQAGGSDVWIEVCTVLGAKRVALDPAQSGDQTPASMDAMDHCPYCMLQANALGMPPATTLVSNVGLLSYQVPRTFLFAPRLQFAWTAAQPRAPPLA